MDWPDETRTTFIVITDADRRRFPELDGFHYVALEESEQGFVYGQAMTEATFEAQCGAHG
jgi:hypothetical protein